MDRTPETEFPPPATRPDVAPDQRRWLWSASQRRVLAWFTILVAALLGWRLIQRPAQLADPPPDYPLHYDLLKDRLNPNTASAAELSVLPGLGPAKAQAIIEYRQSRDQPAFRSVSDLERVYGIGQATAAKLAPYLYFEEP